MSEDEGNVTIRSAAYVFEGKPLLSFKLGGASLAMCWPETDEGSRDMQTILDHLPDLLDRMNTELQFVAIAQNLEGELDG